MNHWFHNISLIIPSGKKIIYIEILEYSCRCQRIFIPSVESTLIKGSRGQKWRRYNNICNCNKALFPNRILGSLSLQKNSLKISVISINNKLSKHFINMCTIGKVLNLKRTGKSFCYILGPTINMSFKETPVVYLQKRQIPL